ncbi:glycine/D-amino acid oxidase-like deaminating enzyme [Planktotalea frisia]|jgi:glycine/D-amino acid oxidase-like deaminating enzyme|uniref:D-amino acid dehydrogenase small subunit n=1 Tax=Planktotalea frisia TaxID=696762 RepID=A0A1L9P2J0_9RHOB|nr:D-amino acid dehydrogenase small subunit [Planktotalea frisia]PZX21104.1 glycine/D-amino acid oxidase-like deaminating enzyme [Planktotalea frisia]
MATQTPNHSSYDVVIVGGAIMGASVAWFLSDDPDFDGKVLVVERDTSYEFSSTMHTNSCMRQQFSTELNVRISQFAADFVKNLPRYMGNDDRVPDLSIQNFGYMYLADNDDFADVLRESQATQIAAGAATQLMSPEQIKAAYPFYNVDDIVLGSINLVDEGFWDATAVFDWWRRSARERGVEYVQNEVVAMTKNAAGTRVENVKLKSGEVIACAHVLNASGPRAIETAKMAGVAVPVEPRKRFSWIFSAEKPLDRDLPLTIDPSGIHVRENGGGTYQCGGHSEIDPAVDYDDFQMDHSIWENHVWPVLATRIPQFEAIKVQSEGVGITPITPSITTRF